MSKLLGLIDHYKDTHGQPSDASIARAVGVAPQTISSWRKRGIRELPERDTMERLALFIGVPYRGVLQAALVDSGYMAEDQMDPSPNPPPSNERGVRGA